MFKKCRASIGDIVTLWVVLYIWSQRLCYIHLTGRPLTLHLRTPFQVVHGLRLPAVPFWLVAISYPESSGFLVSGATPGRLWGHQILLPQDFCGKTMETVTEQPIKKIEFFRCPQSLPGVAPLTKKPEDSGYEIGLVEMVCS